MRAKGITSHLGLAPCSAELQLLTQLYLVSQVAGLSRDAAARAAPRSATNSPHRGVTQQCMVMKVSPLQYQLLLVVTPGSYPALTASGSQRSAEIPKLPLLAEPVAHLQGANEPLYGCYT